MSRRTLFAIAIAVVMAAVVASGSLAANPAVLTASPSSTASSPLVLTAGDSTGRTVTFTNGDKSKSTTPLVATLTGTGFSKVADGCSGHALGPRKSCSVRVTYPGPAPATAQNASLTVGARNGPSPSVTAYFTVPGPPEADLGLAKSVSDPTPNVGDDVTFTVTLSNSGGSTATGVKVDDALPIGLTFVSSTASQGTYDPASGLWTVGTVSVASPQTLMIRATVTSPTELTNTATINAADQSDPDADNNTASATETPQQADLSLTKTVSDPTPTVGDTVTFTVTLSNAGPDTATGVTVTDLLPDGLTFVSSTPSQGSYDPNSGIWTVGTVTEASPPTLMIDATVDSAVSQTNTATGDADQFDPNAANNSASATEVPQ